MGNDIQLLGELALCRGQHDFDRVSACSFHPVSLLSDSPAEKIRFFHVETPAADLLRTVTAIMASRPDFAEAEFRKYWQTAELADIAMEICQWVRETWALPDKMLYPNDSPMLFYELKMIGDDENYEVHFLESGVHAPELIFDHDLTFAQLAEMTLASKKMLKQLREKKKI